MARFNTPSPMMSLSAATTFTYAFGGGIISLTGTAGYTVTLVAPASGAGIPQTFYNITGGAVTLATPSGSIIGNGLTSAASQTIPNNATYTLTSDGTNYILANNEGGPINGTTATFTSTVSMSPSSANVTISPTGSGTVTIGPATAGTINNVAIGGTTRGAGSFTSLDANSTVGLSPSNANVTISPTGTGAVTISPAGSVTISPTSAGTINNVAIGGTTRGAGSFTSLDANSTVGLSPSNANVTISPSGSGTVTISPATAGNINNINIGGTTRGSGNFTTLDANSTVNISGNTTHTGSMSVNSGANNQSYTTTGSAVISISSAGTGSINNMNIGSTTRGSGNFTTLDVNSTVNISGNTTHTGTLTILDPTASTHAATKSYVDNKPVWSTASVLTDISTTISSISIQLTATSGSTVTYSHIGGTLPTGTSLNTSTGLISGTYTTSGTTNFSFTVRATVGSITADRTFSINITYVAPGQVLYEGSAYNSNGGSQTYTWTVPTGVTSVSVAAIGGGGGGAYPWAVCGGAGGGLVWANGVPVTPGASYTILAGDGGCWSGSGGGYSCFPGLIAGGGRCGCCPGCYYLSGTYTSGCGSCGTIAYPTTAGGGGGGGGYCNNNAPYANSGYTGCYGGGGSAGQHGGSTYGTAGGGGTGILGQGTNGTCSNAAYSHSGGGGGGGGSGGTNGNPGEPWGNGQGHGYGCGGNYGGGGGGGGTSHGGGWGGKGAVRIMWGGGRSYPTNAGNV